MYYPLGSYVLFQLLLVTMRETWVITYVWVDDSSIVPDESFTFAEVFSESDEELEKDHEGE